MAERNDFRPFEVVHAGEILKEELKARGIKQKDFAKQIDMQPTHLSSLIKGKIQISEKIAYKLEQALGIPAIDWLNMQSNYNYYTSKSEGNVVETLEEDALYAKFSADKTPLLLGSVELPCYVLNNGVRVFSGRGIQKAIGNQNASGTWLQKFVSSDAIKQNLHPDVFERFNSPIEFKRVGAGGSQSVTYGYEATLLVDLCTAIIDAYNSRQYVISEEYYMAANVILRAVAKVGIIALVDEATGYNKEKNRAKDELQRFLAEFINKEASAWVKTFDDTFFEDIYKMRNWTWAKASAKPSFVGKIINDIVYERIAPVVLKELRDRNPKNESGNRRYKFHQFLTSDVGRPALKQHLAILHSFAIVSDYNWSRFMALLDKAHPKQYQQLALFDECEIG